MDKAKVEKFLELLDEIVNEDGPLGNYCKRDALATI